VKKVWVVAQLLEGREDPDEAAGVWEVNLEQELEAQFAAGAALDVFHSSVAISELEDFEISTLNPQDRAEIFEAAGYVQDSGTKGSVHLIAPTLEQVG
jgi:hypothetical protein